MLVFMIANEHLHVTVREPISQNPHVVSEIYLAPFGAAELEGQMPFKPEYTEYDPFPDAVDATTTANVLSWFEDDAHASVWGIYTDTPSVGSFVGTSGATQSEVVTGNKTLIDRTLQETHIGLFSKEFFGKGIGSLALLSTMKYIREQQNVSSFYAYTSEWNTAVHRTMHKLGFVLLNTMPYISFPGGEKTEYWITHAPESQAKLPRSQRSLFRESWRRHMALADRIDVTRIR